MLLNKRFGEEGLLDHKNNPKLVPFFNGSLPRTKLDELIEELKRHIQVTVDKKARQKLLRDALAEVKVVQRPDSTLCAEYVRTGEIDLNFVVQRTAMMRYLHEYCPEFQQKMQSNRNAYQQEWDEFHLRVEEAQNMSSMFGGHREWIQKPESDDDDPVGTAERECKLKPPRVWPWLSTLMEKLNKEIPALAPLDSKIVERLRVFREQINSIEDIAEVDVVFPLLKIIKKDQLNELIQRTPGADSWWVLGQRELVVKSLLYPDDSTSFDKIKVHCAQKLVEQEKKVQSFSCREISSVKNGSCNTTSTRNTTSISCCRERDRN